eukprot:CAMPEP_0201477256 /NCGR_PEP_ID=MMETSP0151_2-20130828/2314_1 /ASSEMBLY_ACC=CAM_ASM_000257 /TAXON_ID=200890 /ORGANISM="Paramoeba atlantica, Strain 621/1 / CCAP 1560/9" /LENGTH=628 /DNA_ID=CAMNT_0047857907 /DNA_START=6 /DNA_END=1889 /DNA_ORIENTATION=+
MPRKKEKEKEKKEEEEAAEPFVPFRSLVREVILSCIRGVHPGPDRNPYKVLVLDDFSKHLVSTHVRMYDILEEWVDIVENLDMDREPLPNKEAIYLITPTRESIQGVIKDFESKKPQYATAHLFFTAPLGDDLFSKLTQSGARSFISSLKELNLMFYLQESQVFHTETPGITKVLYSPYSDKAAITEHLGEIAFKLATVFSVLGEFPLIRFDKRSFAAKKLSGLLKEKIEFLVESGSEMIEKSSAPADERCTVLIVDRSFDLLAPILHELSYQAMIYDLLTVDDKHRVEHTYTDNAGTEQTKKVVLSDENDQLWVRLRHMHIAETSKWVVKNFNDYIAANKKAGNLEVGKVATLKEMSEAMRAMPQYQDMKSKYAVHIELANLCMITFKKKNLRDLGMLEQDMAVGVKRKNLKKDLSQFFNSDDYSKSDKLRLFLIYLISQSEQGRLSVSDKEEVAIDAGHPPDPQGDAKILKCLDAMGVKLSKASLKEGAKEAKEREKEEKKSRRRGGEEEDETDDLSRYIPRLKRMLEAFLKNDLPASQFPYVTPPASEPVKAQSSSSSKAKWGKKEKEGGAKSRFTKGRVILFVLGGASFSEVRTVYEMTDAFQREIILGSTGIYNPQQFVKTVK